MPLPLRATRYRRQTTDGTTTVAAHLDDFEVWFTGASLANAPERGDAFLAIGLLPAMVAGRTLDLEDLPPVSAPLLDATQQIQEIWTTWNRALHRVEVRATPAPIAAPVGDRTATFFSGGVDAVHTVLEAGRPGEELVYINGFDFDATAAQRAAVVARLERLVPLLEGRLSLIDTNWIRYTRHLDIARSIAHGGCLMAVAHLLAPRRMTIAASYTWDHLTPWGSHPLLDPLWSSDLTAIRHWGTDALRTEKVARIAAHPELMAAVTVCHHDPVHNCGHCSKCVRTLAVLHLIGAATDGFVAPVTDPVHQFLQSTRRGAEYAFLHQFEQLAEERQAPAQVRREIRAVQRSIARHQALRRLRTLLAPGLERRAVMADALRPWGRGPIPDWA
jgi:hypothetical protein